MGCKRERELVHGTWYWIIPWPDSEWEVARYTTVDGYGGFWIAGCETIRPRDRVVDVGEIVGINPNDMVERWRGLSRSDA
jgi:hypothetical protein